MELLSSSSTFQIAVNESTGSDSIADAFLERGTDGYRVLFLGKNGEP